MIKKIMITIIAFLLFFILFNCIPQYQDKEPQSFSYKLVEVKNILDNYFIENKILLEEGTQDYYLYLLDQLMNHTDKKLEALVEYDIILDYASEYLILYQNKNLNNYFNKTIGEVSKILKYEDKKLAIHFKNNKPDLSTLKKVPELFGYYHQFGHTFYPTKSDIEKEVIDGDIVFLSRSNTEVIYHAIVISKQGDDIHYFHEYNNRKSYDFKTLSHENQYYRIRIGDHNE